MGTRGRQFLSVVVLAAALGGVPTPGLATDAASEADGPLADCRGDAGPGSFEVRCEVSGVEGDAEIVLRVRAPEVDDERTWVGGGTVGDDGRGEAAVAVPCTDGSPLRAEVLVPTADDGRFRHVQDLDPAQCEDAGLMWLPAGVGAGLLAALGLLAWRWRRGPRRRRVTRGRRGRPGSRRPRDGGRRRSPRRRSRRR